MAVERVIIEITGDTTKIQSTISELEKLGKVDRANSDSFKRTNKQFNDDLAKTKNSLGGFGDQLNSLKQQVIGAFAVSSLIAFGKEAVATAAKIEGIGNSLKFITGSSANAEKTMTYLRELSNRLGLEFESTAQAFKLFAGATTQAGMTLGQTKSIFESVSKAVTTMGLSADDANGVFLALSQVMSKGTVQAEELRGQIGERIPGAFTIAAKSIGVTEQQLNKMLEQGQVLSKDFLPKFAKQLEKDLGGGAENAANSTQAALNRISNAYSSFKDWFGSTIVAPIVQGTAKIIKAMQDVTPQSKASAMAQADLNAEYAKFEKTINDLEFSELKYIKAQELIMKAKDDEKKAIKDQKQAYSDLGEYMLTYYNERQRRIIFDVRSQQGEEAYLTRLTLAGDQKIKNLVQEIRLNGEYANGYADLIPKMEEYQKGLIQENTATDANIEKKDKKTKTVEKELNAYEKLVKAARDLEEAMKVTLAEKKIISPEAIKQLDDFKFQIDYIERTLKNISNPDLKNINVGSSADKVPIKMLEETPLPPGDYGKAATDAETAALLALQDEYWKDQEAYENAQKEKTRIAKEEAEKRKAAEEAFWEKLPQFASQAIGIIAQYQQQSSQYELTLLDEKLKSKQISEKEYEKERRKILTKQAQDQKAAAILQATIDIAGSIMATLKQFGGTPYGIALAAVTAGLGAAQLAVIQSQKIPKFKKGTDYVSLNGNPRGEDTIPALLNEGEAIITTEQNAKYPGLAKAWNDGKLDEHIYSKWMTPELILKKSLEREAIDYDRLGQSVADSIKKNPQVKVSFDKSGFATYVIKGNSVINYQNNRYSSK